MEGNIEENPRASSQGEEGIPTKAIGVQRPVPACWRPIFSEVVRAFIRGDFALEVAIPSVQPPSSKAAVQMQGYVVDYGERLAELCEETWQTSVAVWTGRRWDVHLDLRTVESGRSDMVLDARVFEDGDGFRFELDLIYVP